MSKLKDSPVKHDHAAILAKAASRAGFSEAYESLELEYQVVSQLLKARASRPDPRGSRTAHGHHEECGFSVGLHATARPPLSTLKRFANAVGCELQVKLVAQR